MSQSNNSNLFQFVLKIIQLCRPYFGLKGENLWNSMALVGMLLVNALGAIAISMINSGFAALTGVLLEPMLTYAMVFRPFMQVTVMMGVYAACYSATEFLSNYLGIKLAQSISKNLLERWVETEAYYGLDAIILEDGDSLNARDVLSYDIPKVTRKLISLINMIIIVTFNGLAGIQGLYQLSGSLQFALAGFTFTIPAYMLVVTIAYALVTHQLTHWIGGKIKLLQEKLQQSESIARDHISAVYQSREAIAFKQGASFDKKSILKSLDNIVKSQKMYNIYQSALGLVNVCQDQFASIFALLLAIPNLVAKTMAYENIFPLMQNFSMVTSLFSLKSQSFDKISECETHVERIERFQKQIDTWAEKRNNSQLKRTTATSRNNNIQINNLNVQTGNGQPILTGFTATLSKNKRTLISGPSGSGKTTVLRCMAGLTANASGEISGLPANTVFLPSTPYFPYQESLIGSICYPSRVSRVRRNKTVTMLKELGLENLVKDLDNVKDWKAILSDGQQQRLMLISALIREPDCLVMDEATSRVDHLSSSNTKLKMEDCVKKYMNGKTVIYTDHNPSHDFPEQSLKMRA